MEGLKQRRKNLDGERSSIMHQMRSATLELSKKKKLIEKQMRELDSETRKLEEETSRIAAVVRHGLGGAGWAKSFWDSLMGG
jgi:hypothetical protein